MLRRPGEDKALSPLLLALLGLPRAVGFLTILPVPRAAREAAVPADFVLPWFPVVGLIIGFLLLLPLRLLPSAGPLDFRAEFAAAALQLVLWALVTGALHLDGLGDVLDGLALRATPEDRKAVLRDPHVGAVGAAGLAVFVLLKFGALLASPTWGVLLAPATARAATVVCMCLFPYGRLGEGTLGSTLWPRKRAAVAISALLVLAAVVAAFAPWRPMSLLASGAALLWAIVFGSFLARSFGGLTGDCCGAICETSEAAFLLALSGLH